MYYRWRQYLQMPDAQLGGIDIAVRNLECAEGLPGADKIDIPLCLRRLNSDAARVQEFIEHYLPRYRENTDKYASEASFRATCLVTVLQRDLGLRYNPAKKDDSVPLDMADCFIHGALFGDGGTCCSLPVVVAAVGRRLGYPIKLVEARGEYGHVFCRWDDPQGPRFNMEVTATGLSCPPDEYYRTGWYKRTRRMQKTCGLLKSLTPREELAMFLKMRGDLWRQEGKHRRAVESYCWAFATAPHNKGLEACFGLAMNDWNDALEKSKPMRFPELCFYWNRRRILPESIPWHMEKSLLYLWAFETLLQKPKYVEMWWKPLLAGVIPPWSPRDVDVLFFHDGEPYFRIPGYYEI